MKLSIEAIRAAYDTSNSPCEFSKLKLHCPRCSFVENAPEMVGFLLAEMDAHLLSESEKKLLQAIWEYMDDTGDGAPDSSSLAQQNLNFSEPLHQLIKRLR